METNCEDDIMDFWLTTMTPDRAWDIFQDIDESQFQKLTDLLNNRGSDAEIGVWCKKTISDIVSKWPEYYSQLEES